MYYTSPLRTTYVQLEEEPEAAEIDIFAGLWEDLEEDEAAEPVY